MHRRLAGTLTGPVTKWIVLAVWVVILVVSSMFASKLADEQNNEASSWLPASAESTRALDRLTEFQKADAIPTVVVYVRSSGLSDEDIATARKDAAEFAAVRGVEGPVRGPFVSSDGKAMQTIVTFDFGSAGWNAMPDAVDQLRAIASFGDGRVYVTGAGGQAADSAKAFGGIDSTLLASTLGIVIVILLLTYRSPVLWILPMICSGVALFGAQALIYVLARYAGLTVNGQSYAILTILVIGAGTDYALLVVARYREELRNHEDRHQAMASALHRAAPAILASAATVILGMLCLLLAEMNSTAGLGPVAAIGIGVTFLVQVTLLPALLTICGRWVFWPQRPTYGSLEPTRTGFWARIGRRISVRPRLVWVVTAGVLALACLGSLRLDTSGLATDQQYTRQFDSILGQKALVEHGMVDQSNTVDVVARADKAEAVRAAMVGLPGIETPAEPVVIGDLAMVKAALTSDIASPTSFSAVRDVRTATHAVAGADALVAGARRSTSIPRSPPRGTTG
jgi:putative drug exporter of the RND superfamily